MAKCPKCRERKAKRDCPALPEGVICSTCCAQHRLQTIPCPQDCPHLRAEIYQLERRRRRAQSAGKGFLKVLFERFLTREAQTFAFQVQADLYWWMGRHGRADNTSVVRALDEVLERVRTVIVNPRAPGPLAAFLLRLFAAGRYESQPGPFGRSDQVRSLETLKRHVQSHGDEGSYSFHQEIASYFDQLDFEADLDYSPTEFLERPRRPGLEKRRSGLLLPRTP